MGPRGEDPYTPRPPAPFTTERVEVTDPATGLVMRCVLRLPAQADAPLPLVIHTAPPHWSPTELAPDGGFMAEHLSAAGYATLTVEHLGSDRAVVLPVHADKVADKATYVNSQIYKDESHAARVGDLRFLLDSVERWDRNGRNPFDPSRIGMSGYSFGGLVMCLLLGQRTAPNFTDYRDPRVRAGIAYSNSAMGLEQPLRCFHTIDRPALYMTGTGDFSYGRPLLPQRKLAAYAHSRVTDQYSLMLHNADHHTFGGGRLQKDKIKPRELLCHQWMRSISLAFWDVYLRDDPAARRWLDQDCARLLGRDGRFRRK